MSCGCKREQEKDSSPSLIDKKSIYAKAIQAIKDAKPEDITDQVTYMDSNCHGCLVGHILKITDGLDYKKYKEDQIRRTEHIDILDDGLVRKYMKKNFGENALNLDITLSTIHDDYINDGIDFAEMQQTAIECLESFRDQGIYEYEPYETDYDDEDE